MKCHVCEGKGGWYDDYGYVGRVSQDCPVCRGTGRIGFVTRFWIWFWDSAPVELIEFVERLLGWLCKIEERDDTV